MLKKKFLFLMLSLFTFSVVLYPLSVSAQPQYASNTGNQCTYCHNAGYSLNANGQAYRSAGYPAVLGWKNNVSSVKPTVPSSNNTTNKSKDTKQSKKHTTKKNKKYKAKEHKKTRRNHHDDDDHEREDD